MVLYKKYYFTRIFRKEKHTIHLFLGLEINLKQHKYMDLIYNNNWILNDNNFGFLNHVIKKWDKNYVCHDGHPNTRSQKWLFEQILSRIKKSLI